MRCALAAGVLVAGFVAPVAHAQPSAVDSALEAAVARDDLAGAIATVRNGATVTTMSAGFADPATEAPFGPDTRVRIASITKTFVAAAVLQLVGEGVVDLDTPVETYLPGLLHGASIDGNAITVRHLLRHQSGLPEYFDDTTEPPDRPVSAREYVAQALAKPGVPPGGPVPVYTNTNYFVAGLLLEAVTGRPAADEITRRIIVPLGLTHTYFPHPGDTGLSAPMAHGYETVDGRRTDVTAAEPSGYYMAGALVSTGEDTTEFIAALLDGRVVGPAELEQMMDTVAWPLHGPQFRYGLGLVSIDLVCGIRVWGHGGDLPGYHSIAVAAVGHPAVAATFTQGTPGVTSLANDPRLAVLTAVYCPG